MIGYVSRAFFHTLAGSRTLQQLASRYGMRRPNSFARRFIAGETIDEAIAAARTIEANGMTHTLDLLGESVATMSEADAATRAYLALFVVYKNMYVLAVRRQRRKNFALDAKRRRFEMRLFVRRRQR